MSFPTVLGIHHVKIPVGDLSRSLTWFHDMFNAKHERALDHVDTDGATFASIVTIPGVAVPIELRWAPIAARRMRECDVLVLAVADDDLAEWIDHLDAQGADHSPVLPGPGGSVLVVVDPDGKYIRLMAPPPNHTAADLTHQRLDPHGPWLNPIPMRHPRTTAEGTQPTERPAS